MAEETKIIRLVIDASRAVEGSAAATRALEKLEKQQAATASTLDRMESALGKVGGAIKAQLALMVADLAARFLQLAKNSFDAVSGLDELAEQLGITTRGVQALQFSAAQNGVSLEKLEGGVGKFSQKMGEAAEGSKEMVEALDRLGVKNLDAQGKLRPTEALMRDVAEAILKIEDPAKRAAASVDFFGKAGQKMQTMLPDMAAGVDTLAQKAAAAGAMIDDKTVKALDKLADSSSVASLRWRAMAATFGEPIATWALEKINSILASVLKNLDRVKELDATKNSRALQNDAQNLDDQIAAQRNLLAINPRNTMAQSSLAALEKRKQAATDAANAEIDQRATTMLVSGTFPPTEPLDPEGARSSTVKGSGPDIAERINKQTEALKLAAAAQNEMTAAARGGDVAFAEQEIRLKALQLALSAYGDKAKASDAEVQKLADSYERLVLQDVQGKVAQSFVMQTTELQKQNALLEAENRLLDAAPDIRARELAVLKSVQEAQKAGNALTAEDIEARRQAIEINERLKTQAEDLKKAQELWIEPAKQAFRDIQTAGADAFDQLLESGKFSAESMGQTFTKILRRMAAEFLALATIRPVMSVMVSAVASTGMISPASASSMGYGANGVPGLSSGGAGGSSIGMPGASSLSGFEMPSWLGGGQPFAFLNQPVSSLFSSGAPAGGYADVGALLSSGNTGASAAATGGLSIGSALGGLGSIGMGAYSLFNAKGNTGKTIGGIGQMVGGAMMMIPGLQPVGAVVSLLSSVLPGLFGGDEYKLPPLVGASANFLWDGKGYGASTGTSLNGGTAPIGESKWLVDALQGWTTRAAGGKPIDASRVYGFNIWRNQRDGTSASYVMDPNGGSTEMSNGSGDQSGAYQRTISAAFRRSVLGGAFAGASPTLTQALTNRAPGSIAETSGLLDFVEIFDKFGKVTPNVREQLDKISATFASLTDTARAYGIALEPIAAEQAKQTKRYAQDFIDNMIDPLAAQLRALQDEREQGLASAQYIRDNVADVYVDMAKVAAYYTRKEADLREQFYGGAVASLEQAIRRLTTGDLSNTSPTTGLAGLRASYGATLAQARAGSSSAIGRLAAEGADYAAAGQQYFASSAEYQALVEQIRRDLAEVQAAIQAPSASSDLGANSPAMQTMLAGNEQLRQIVSDQSAQIASLTTMVDRLTGQLQRVAVVGR
jgi:hypothetical protein